VRKLTVTGYIVVGIMLTTATAWAIREVVLTADEPKPAASTEVTTAAEPAIHEVHIRQPTAPKGVDTGKVDVHGQAITLACRNCHDIRPANSQTRATEHLKTFHQGLAFNHGSLACVACHNAQDGYATLHLADGSAVEYANTMTLCAQCHGSQFRDYQHGSHGGMTGYWDLSQGPRQRNHCVDCHDPHSPQFPMMYPAAGPKDRFSPSHSNKDSVH